MASLLGCLTEIYRERGELTPKIVVDLARDPGHPLHSRFEWDDSVAAEKYRQVQAGELIRTVKIREVKPQKSATEEPLSVRAFHSVPRPDGNTYVPVEEVAADPMTRQMVLTQAEREWKQLLSRYKHLKEFIDMVRTDLSA